MKIYTIEDIRALGPCYDPVTGLDKNGKRHNDGYLPEDWTGTAVDILRVTDCPPEDRLWVVSQWLDDRTSRLFAVWCIRQALALIDNPDPRSIEVCDIAERFANGKATRNELLAAWDAASAVAREATWDNSWVAWDVARCARDVVWDAAKCAREAARAACDAAAREAARAACDAAAREAARAAAMDAAWEEQIRHLIEMIENDAE